VGYEGQSKKWAQKKVKYLCFLKAAGSGERYAIRFMVLRHQKGVERNGRRSAKEKSIRGKNGSETLEKRKGRGKSGNQSYGDGMLRYRIANGRRYL